MAQADGQANALPQARSAGQMSPLGLDLYGNLRVNESFTSATALTIGVSAAVGRALLINCTVAGNVTVAMQDGSYLTFSVGVGTTLLLFSVSQVSSTTTTATFYSLK